MNHLWILMQTGRPNFFRWICLKQIFYDCSYFAFCELSLDYHPRKMQKLVNSKEFSERETTWKDICDNDYCILAYNTHYTGANMRLHATTFHEENKKPNDEIQHISV